MPPGEWMQYGINGHFSIVTYYSIAYLAFAAVGILSLTRKAQTDGPLLRLTVMLGVIPASAGFMLQFYGHQIPFVRSVDSTRIWWFSNVFLVLALGRLLDSSWQRVLSWPVHQWLIGISAFGIAFAYFRLPKLIPEFSEIAPIYHICVLGTILGLFAILLSSWRIGGLQTQQAGGDIMAAVPAEDMRSIVGKGLIVFVLLLALVPTLVHVLGLNKRSCDRGNHYFANSRESTFQPSALLQAMVPGYRMAAEESPVEGHDLKAIFGGVLGSNARAIVSSQALMEIFDRQQLIKLDYNYYFAPPWQPDKLNRLGVRYLLLKQRSNELEIQGWANIASDEPVGQHFLYENPSKASPIHLLRDGQPVFLHNYELVPNGIRVQLPEQDYSGTLVASFFYRSSWRARVDGKEVMPAKNDLGMMQLPISPGARTVLFQFRGLNAWDFFVSFLFSVVVLGIGYFAKPLWREG